MARELTDKQKRVLSTLEAYWTEHQVPPSISDLAKQLGINKATAYEHLLALKKKGYLLHQARAGRTWRPAHHSKEVEGKKQIPLFNEITQNPPLLDRVNIDAYIASDHQTPNTLLAVRVHDNSMSNAHILPNDVVVVDPKASIHHRDIVLAFVDGRQAIRRYEETPQTTLITAENDGFAARELGSLTTLIGKVIEIRRYLLS